MSFLLVLSAAVHAAAAGSPLGMREFTSVDELAASIQSHFPKVQGEIKDVRGDEVTFTLGSRDGLQKGALLTVWRDGKEILHPVTNMVIGRMEDQVGSLEVTGVGDKTSTGVLVKKITDPKPGDKARITPKKISMALVPLRPDHAEIIQKLGAKLREGSRFTLLDIDKTAAFIGDKKERDRALISEMGRVFKLDVAVTIDIVPADDKYVVTAGIFYADEGRPFDTIVAMLDLRTRRDALGEVKPFFAPAPEEQGGIPDLTVDARLFAIADFDGTGGLQYVFSDGIRLHVFKQGLSGWREIWTETVSYGPSEMHHINLDIADINGNGTPEIFITAMLNGKIVSYVVECRDGVYRRIADLPGFLRVVVFPRTGSILLGQAYDPASFFGGKPKQYVWADGKYTAGAEFVLPRGLGLYGFVIAELGEQHPLLVALDEKEQLVVYSNNAPVWRSEEKFPSFGIVVARPLAGIDQMFSSGTTEAEKVRVRGRVLALDLNGDGKDEILLPRNSGAALLTGFKEAEFVSLGWTGARLERRGAIPDIPGAVLDFQALKQPGLGTRIVSLVLVPGGMFGSDRIRVMTYAAP